MLLTDIIILGGLGAIVLAMFGVLLYAIISQAKATAVAETKANIEHDTATQLHEADKIIAAHSEPDDAERSLRDGSF